MSCLHGDVIHACVHEGGHALAALERSIPFIDAVVFAEPRRLRDELQMGGRVKLDDKRSWRSMAPLPMFEFALAGACAEQSILGHELPGGWGEDVTRWRQAVGAFEGRRAEGYIAILGESIPDVRVRMNRWAVTRMTALLAIASALSNTGDLP